MQANLDVVPVRSGGETFATIIARSKSPFFKTRGARGGPPPLRAPGRFPTRRRNKVRSNPGISLRQRCSPPHRSPKARTAAGHGLLVDPNPGPSLLCEGRPTYGFIRSERVGRRRQEGPILRKRGAVRPTPRILASRKPASLARPGSARTRCREGEAKEREGSGVGQQLGTLPPGARSRRRPLPSTCLP